MSLGIKGKIVSINTSKKKGQKKKQVGHSNINKNGIEGDGHSGKWHRQVSLLSFESIQSVIDRGVKVKPGDFAENLTISGIDFQKIKKGDVFYTEGKEKVKLMVTQIGKKCHTHCNIFYQLGYCIMPTKGIFCKVLSPGRIYKGENIFLSRSF